MSRSDLIDFIKAHARAYHTPEGMEMAVPVGDLIRGGLTPVRHSRWIYDDFGNLYCKRCGSPHGGGFSFCSYCGAIMDEKEN